MRLFHRLNAFVRPGAALRCKLGYNTTVISWRSYQSTNLLERGLPMDKRMDKAAVLQAIEENDVHFVRFWFTDVLGNLKSFEVTRGEVESAFEEGMGFDGSSIEGFARLQESDMIAYPDPTTFKILPTKSQGKVAARMFCNITRPDGTPFEGCPRGALKKQLQRLDEMGYVMNVGPELEYFYFKSPTDPTPIDAGGYFDMTPIDDATDIRRATVLALQEAGIIVEYSHHEVAPGQQEIDLRYTNALDMADQVMTYRLIVKEVARQHGAYASFMPKPITGMAGNGMHVHQSIFDKSGNNMFYDANDPQGFHLSKFAKHYIAGLLKYAPEFCCITNQYVNSYKRLVTGFEAPVYITWARRNRSALVRIPLYKPDKPLATRLEIRNPDPSCNPYLTFAVMLGAGLKGVEEELELPEECTRDVFAMSHDERKEAGIKTLPGDLGRATELFEDSALMKEVLGEHIHRYVCANKRAEWKEYRAHVSRWELSRYLPVL